MSCAIVGIVFHPKGYGRQIEKYFGEMNLLKNMKQLVDKNKHFSG